MRRLQDENHKSNVSKISGKKRHFTSRNIFTEYFESSFYYDKKGLPFQEILLAVRTGIEPVFPP